MWLKINEFNIKKYNEAAKNNCRIKFDNGYICHYNEEWPFAEAVEFEIIN